MEFARGGGVDKNHKINKQGGGNTFNKLGGEGENMSTLLNRGVAP